MERSRRGHGEATQEPVQAPEPRRGATGHHGGGMLEAVPLAEGEQPERGGAWEFDDDLASALGLGDAAIGAEANATGNAATHGAPHEVQQRQGVQLAGGRTGIQHKKKGPSGPHPIWRIAAEDAIKGILRRSVDSCDAAGLQARKRDLLETFAALPVYDRETLRQRLTLVDADDELAYLFHYRLATPTRRGLIRALDGEPTPLPNPHDSIEVEAFLVDIVDGALTIQDPIVLAQGQQFVDVPIALRTPHTPPEGHQTEIQWIVNDADGELLHRSSTPWPPTQTQGVQHTELMSAGRDYLLAQVVIDGTVRKMLRRLVTVLPPGGAVTDAPMTPEIEQRVREAFAHPIRRDRRGNYDNEQREALITAMTTIASPYRPALVARLSSPPPGDDLGALFVANVPADLRPDVLAALTGRFERLAEDGSGDVALDNAIARVDLQPHPPRLVVGPWMEKADVELQLHDPESAEARYGQADPDGELIEVWWTVTSPTKEVTEHRTTWTHSRTRGESLHLSLSANGSYWADVRFSHAGVVLGQRLVEIPVEVAKEGSELTAAQAMHPEQIEGERARLRERMATDDGDRNDIDDAQRTQDQVVFGALGAAAQGMEAPPEAEPKPAGDLFAPPDWTSGTIFQQPALSTDPAHLRFVCERYLAKGDPHGERWMPDVLLLSLRAFINYLSNRPDREADLAQARAVYAVLETQVALIDQERHLLIAEFGRRAVVIGNQLLDNSMERINAARRKYGIEPGSDAAAGDVAELATAATQLVELQLAVEREEERKVTLQSRLDTLDQMMLEDQAAYANEFVELDLQLADATEQAETKQRDFELVQGELSMRYPILAMADAEGDDLVEQKHRYDIGALRKLAGGDVGYMAGQLDETEINIGDVRVALDTESVWTVPDLVALTQQTMGMAPGSFQNQAVLYKLGMIRAGNVVRGISTAGINLIALLTAWCGVGEAIWLIEGLVLAKDVYDLSKTIQQYQFEKALHGTDYDKAMALSAVEPSLFWLAFDIVATLVGGASSIKSLNDARKAFVAVRTARNAVKGATTAEELTTRLAELEKVVADLKLSTKTADRLRTSSLDELAKRTDDVGEAARKALSGADPLGDATRTADAADDVAGTAADAGRSADDIKADLEAKLGAADYDRLSAGGLKDNEIAEAIRGLGSPEEVVRVAALFTRPDMLLTLRNKLGWRNLRLLSKHMDGPGLLAFVEGLDPMKLRFLGRMEDAAVESFARLDLVTKQRLLQLSDEILIKAVQKFPGAMDDFVACFGKIDDALILRLLDHADAAHVFAMIHKLSPDALAKFKALPPANLDELLGRNKYNFDSIGAQSPADQVETFERIVKHDLPFTKDNVGELGHPATRHGPYQSDAAMFERARGAPKPMSRWETWDALEGATEFAKKQVSDPPTILALGKHDHSPINANGWKRIDRQPTQAAKLQLINDMLTQPANRGFLKEKVELARLHPPGGKLFYPDGVTIQQTDKTLTVLALDDSGVYRVVTAFPVP